MDTVNRALEGASHAIWGETHPHHLQHGEEPLSGVQGRGTATDPYDAGNRDDPTGNNSSPLSPAINEEIESQLGSGPADGSTAFAAANIPSAAAAEEPPYGKDAPSSALDSALNRSRVPEGRRIASNPLGTGEGDMESTTGIHSGLGQAGRTSINPTMMMAGGVGGGGAMAGTSAAAAEAAGLSPGGREAGPSFEQRAQGAGGGGSDGGGGGYSGGEQHSKEALMGPQSPPPRAEYDFEKELNAGRTAKESAQDAKPAQSQPRQHSSAMSKVKERLHLRHNK